MIQPRTFPFDLSSAGAAVGQIRIDNAATLWVVYQLGLITTPTSSGCTCTVKPSGIGIVDTSYFAGTGDVAWGVYFLYPGEYLELTWAAGPANGKGIATIIYDEVLP